MTRLVVDASVAAKWFLDEPHSSEARGIQSLDFDLLAPEFITLEMAHVMTKRIRRGEMSVDQGRNAVVRLPAMLSLRITTMLIPAALDVAVQFGRSAYDALYVVLALRHGCQFVTADRRLYNALAPHLPGTMLWIEDVPEPAG